MKDEEMAEEYANGYATPDLEASFRAYMFEASKDGFLAGLKAGRLQWHDLRKDPNDLPNGYKVVLNQEGMATRYDPSRGFLGLDGIGVIAWCEVPIFDKE